MLLLSQDEIMENGIEKDINGFFECKECGRRFKTLAGAKSHKKTCRSLQEKAKAAWEKGYKTA
jgi:hypothetical protein